ncbi:unnamed protein product, partial [Phaeothamnion confervicola]
VALRAPLALHNLLCTPLLYRLASRDGRVAAEGVLAAAVPPLPLFRVDVRCKQYVSLRVLNYGWSPWVKVH